VDGDGFFLESKGGLYGGIGCCGGSADRPALAQLARLLGSPRVHRPSSGAYEVVFSHRETLLRLVLLLGGEVRHPKRRPLLAALRKRLGLPPLPPPRRSPTIRWFAGHFRTDGSASGLGLVGVTPVLVVSAKGLKLLRLWERRWGGRLHLCRPKQPLPEEEHSGN
jgi:hypothetical protein